MPANMYATSMMRNLRIFKWDFQFKKKNNDLAD